PESGAALRRAAIARAPADLDARRTRRTTASPARRRAASGGARFVRLRRSDRRGALDLHVRATGPQARDEPDERADAAREDDVADHAQPPEVLEERLLEQVRAPRVPQPVPDARVGLDQAD